MYIQHRATSAMRIDDSVVKKCLFLTGARVECRPKLLGLSWKKILCAQFRILEDFFFRFIFKFLLSLRQFELSIYLVMSKKSQFSVIYFHSYEGECIEKINFRVRLSSTVSSPFGPRSKSHAEFTL